MATTGRTITVDAAGNVQSVESDETRERLNWLAWLLDSSIPIPGTRFTIGVDALVGIIPVVGDFVGVLLSSYILKEAARLGAPKVVLARMASNVLIEGIVGIIPFAGDVFDAAWKANQRNVRLLNAWLDHPKKTARSSSVFAAVLISAVLGLLVLLGVLAFLVLRWIFLAIST
jgi:Domain of unknown function (DUF4112)